MAGGSLGLGRSDSDALVGEFLQCPQVFWDHYSVVDGMVFGNYRQEGMYSEAKEMKKVYLGMR